MSLLEAREVSVRFGGNMAVQAASVTVEAAGVTGLIGPNGAGKTTLFNVLTGLQVPTAGRVFLEGDDITTLPPHRRSQRGIARTFQRIELFGSLTVEENLQVAAEIRRSRAAPTLAAAERVAAAVDLVGLRVHLDRRADQLTTGQARLLELARALVTEPTVLLLDEPASGLDADETATLASILRQLAGQGLGILLVEHDVPLVMDICTTIHVLDLGRIIASGAPAAIRENPAVIDAYLGTGASA